MNLLKFERLDAGRWAMQSRYHELFPEMAKGIPGLAWDKRHGAWIGYSDSVCLLTERLEAAKVCKAVGIQPQRAPLSVSPLKNDYGLRDYQNIGTNFVLEHAAEGVLLADSMGLGKSRAALAAIAEGLELPAVIVCPANVKSSWKSEGQKLGLDVHLLFGMSPPDDAQIDKSDGIVALNYELVDKWLPHLKNTHTVIFDEGQMLSNEKSKRSKACRELARLAKYRAILTGTPIQNRPKELFNMVDTISPGRFGRWLPYVKRYCGAFQEDVPVRGGEEGETQKVWNVKGSSHEDELHERLQHFMLRRTKQDVKLEIPAKTRQLITLDVSKSYKNPDRWWSLENKSQTQIALGLAAEGKVDQAVELAINAIESGSSVVLWMHRKEVAKGLKKLLAKQGVSAWMCTGDETPARRQQNAEAAAKQGNSICIATFEAAGTGVNYFVHADIAIFVELHYVPGKMLQAEDRHHRPGQLNPVTIIYLIANDSIDEVIRDYVLKKLKASEEIVGSSGDTYQSDLLGMTEEDAMDALRKSLMEDEGGL